MDILPLSEVNVGDQIEIPADGTDKPVSVTYIRHLVNGRSEVGVKIGLVTYAWDHDSDTEVILLARA